MESRNASPQTAPRLLYIDHARVFLTILVILHHLMITYAHSGGWFYVEGDPDTVTEIAGAWFCAVNQSYFMGLFLLISAYFVPGSYDRKGAGAFLKDRLIRLGIPLAIYSWVVNPVLVYILHREEIGTNFWGFYPVRYFEAGEILGSGPLWFVEVLLIFSLVYVAWRKLTGDRVPAATEPAAATFPSNRGVLLLIIALAVGAFVLRLFFKVDRYTFTPLNLQFAYFSSYIGLFIVGLVAYRRRWLEAMPDRTGRFWLRVFAAMVVFWPLGAISLGAAEGAEEFRGGFYWQAIVAALFESGMCVSAVIGVLYIFRRWFNREVRFGPWLVANAYGAYLVHAPVAVLVALALSGLSLYPLLKWVLAALVAVPLCFALAAALRLIPGAHAVLGAGVRAPARAVTGGVTAT